jgi:NADH:ubiquinone oxidoreductase subunit 5 (subunit L)/multisubunit Na+/H+ antiporter MnhA subunit
LGHANCSVEMYRLKRLRKRTKILICIAVIVMVAIALFYGFWIDFQTYYLDVMKNLNSSETKAYMFGKINGTYNFSELLNWTYQHLNWSEENFVRYSTPQQILDQGKGKCEEFAIVYVSACLALGYEARIVVARQFYLGPVHGFHVWAEVKWNGVWTQADPSPTPFWNDTSRYKSWNWGPRATLVVYAFEDNLIEDVSARYR